MTWPAPTHPLIAAEIAKLRTVWADKPELGFDVVYRPSLYVDGTGGKVAHVLVWHEGRRIDARTLILEET